MMDREEFEDLLCAITASTIANIVLSAKSIWWTT